MCGPADLRRQAQELQQRIQDPRLTPAEVERTKQRLAYVEAELRPYDEECAKKYREDLLKQGSRIVIHFDNKVTPDQLSEKFLKSILQKIVDFDPPGPGTKELIHVDWEKLKRG